MSTLNIMIIWSLWRRFLRPLLESDVDLDVTGYHENCPDDFLKPSHQIKITVHMGQLFTKFDVAKHPRFLSDGKIIKTEGFEVITIQSSNLKGIRAPWDPPLLGYNHFVGKHSSQTKHSRQIRQNQFNYPLENNWLGGTLSKANALASLLTTAHRSCTRFVTQQGALPKILPQAVLDRKQLSQNSKLKQNVSNIVGRIWPASWKDYQKKVIEKLRYVTSIL